MADDGLDLVCGGCKSKPDWCDCEPVSRTWRPVGLGPVLDGTWERPTPSVGRRADGAGLFYPGRVHMVASEAESGKTWLALTAADDELRAGNAVVYVDFEDDAGGVAGRLLSMGTDQAAIAGRFAYIRPEEPVTSYPGGHDLRAALGDLKPTLVVLDGVTEAMTMHGLELKDNTDVAKFGRLLPRRIAAFGPATVALDHVVKDREGRGGHAIGGVHKLNGLDGAMFVLENRDPFGIGIAGRSRLLIRKDRPGALRQRGQPSRAGLSWYADLVVDSRDEEFAEVVLEVPPPGGHGDRAQPPAAILTGICAALGGVAGLSKNAVEGAVKGSAKDIRYGIEWLADKGYVRVEKQGQARVCHLVRSWPDD